MEDHKAMMLARGRLTPYRLEALRAALDATSSWEGGGKERGEPAGRRNLQRVVSRESPDRPGSVAPGAALGRGAPDLRHQMERLLARSRFEGAGPLPPGGEAGRCTEDRR